MKISTYILLIAGFMLLLYFKKKIKKVEAQQRARNRRNRKNQSKNKGWPNTWNKKETNVPRRKTKQAIPNALEKGELAEKELELALKRRLDKKDWYIFSNVTLKRNDDDGTTQIDLVALSVFGVFVIEVKSFKGNVYANKGPSWILHSYNGSQRIYFQNPHRQNHAHVMAIAQTLKPLKNIESNQIESMVMMMGEAKYQGLPENTYTNIDSLIEALEARSEKVINHSHMAVGIGLIEYSRLYDLPETDQAHIEYLQKKHDPETDQTEQKACNNMAQTGTQQTQPIEPTVSEAVQG